MTESLANWTRPSKFSFVRDRRTVKWGAVLIGAAAPWALVWSSRYAFDHNFSVASWPFILLSFGILIATVYSCIDYMYVEHFRIGKKTPPNLRQLAMRGFYLGALMSTLVMPLIRHHS